METNNIWFIIIILIITVSIIVYLVLNKYTYNSDIDTMANYMTADELSKYLINDDDDYYKNFSDLDLKVRKVKNVDDYHNNIRKSCIDIDESSMIILNNCINKANNKLRDYKCTGFDGNKCAKLEWNIGLIKDKLYEEGYPHTRNNIIIIPSYLLNSKNQLINTLIHEKIHVYQKTYPEDIEKYLEANGFTKYKLRNEYSGMANTNTRSNPDMDQWIYKNKNGEIMSTEYNDNPNSLMDVKTIPINNTKYEHPFEFMAYDITNHI
jgi:hypothetical protein